jgi:hypothetical protein
VYNPGFHHLDDIKKINKIIAFLNLIVSRTKSDQ